MKLDGKHLGCLPKRAAEILAEAAYRRFAPKPKKPISHPRQNTAAASS